MHRVVKVNQHSLNLDPLLNQVLRNLVRANQPQAPVLNHQLVVKK
jgi:hypothetical protein